MEGGKLFFFLIAFQKLEPWQETLQPLPRSLSSQETSSQNQEEGTRRRLQIMVELGLSLNVLSFKPA